MKNHPDSAAAASKQSVELPLIEILTRKHFRLVCSLLISLSAAVLLSYYVPPLLRPDVYTGDMCEHIVWYDAAANPALFPNDLMRTYFTSMCPLGYRWLFSTVGTRVSPRVLGEMLSLLLGASGIFLAYMIGKTATRGCKAGGVVATLLFLFGHALGLHEFIKVFQGGLQRAFALPLLLLGIWALLRGRPWFLGAAMALGALFFPPVTVSLATYAMLVMALRLWSRHENRREIWRETCIIAGATAFCALYLLKAAALSSQGRHWTPYTLAEAEKMPEFYPGGIWDFGGPQPILFHHWSDYIIRGIKVPAAPVLLVFMVAFLWRARAFRAETVLLPVSALVNWSLAYLTLFTLFEPSRYIPYPLMALWLLIVPVVIIEISRMLEPRIRSVWRASRPAGPRTRIFAVAVYAITLVVGAAVLITWRARTGQGGMTGTAPPEIYAFLHRLPVNVKIAAHPMDANDIPMRSERSVLAFSRAMWPYHHEFYEAIMARVEATMRALYATNYSDILRLKHTYGADVLVVNQKWYGNDPIHAQPYTTIVEDCRRRLAGAEPLVLHVPKEAILLQQGSFTIVDLDTLERLEPPVAAGRETMAKPEPPQR